MESMKSFMENKGYFLNEFCRRTKACKEKKKKKKQETDNLYAKDQYLNT